MTRRRLLLIVLVGLLIGGAGVMVRQLTNSNHFTPSAVDLTPLNAPKPSGHPVKPATTTTTMAPLSSPVGFTTVTGSDGERVAVRMTGGPTRVRLTCSSSPVDVIHFAIKNLGPFTLGANIGDYASSVSVGAPAQAFRGAPAKCGETYPPCHTPITALHLTPGQSSIWCPLVGVPKSMTSHEVRLDLVELLGGDFIVTLNGGSPTDSIVEWNGGRTIVTP